MINFEFWKPIIVSLIITPLALVLSIASAGAGHGDYFWVKTLFPYTMLSTVLFQSITIPFIILAIIQFPLYGLILAFVGRRKKLVLSTVTLAIIHIVAVTFSFLLIGESFS